MSFITITLDIKVIYADGGIRLMCYLFLNGHLGCYIFKTAHPFLLNRVLLIQVTPVWSHFSRVKYDRLLHPPNRRHSVAAGELFPRALIIKKVGITNVWWEKFSAKSRTRSDTVSSQVDSGALFLKSGIFSFFPLEWIRTSPTPPLSAEHNVRTHRLLFRASLFPAAWR